MDNSGLLTRCNYLQKIVCHYAGNVQTDLESLKRLSDSLEAHPPYFPTPMMESSSPNSINVHSKCLGEGGSGGQALIDDMTC